MLAVGLHPRHVGINVNSDFPFGRLRQCTKTDAQDGGE
jgi:hypothetical protein